MKKLFPQAEAPKLVKTILRQPKTVLPIPHKEYQRKAVPTKSGSTPAPNQPNSPNSTIVCSTDVKQKWISQQKSSENQTSWSATTQISWVKIYAQHQKNEVHQTQMTKAKWEPAQWILNEIKMVIQLEHRNKWKEIPRTGSIDLYLVNSNLPAV